MGHRIFLFLMVLGSLFYGVLAVRAAVTAWQALPATVQAWERSAQPGAEQCARYLRSPWYQGQLALALASGALFVCGAAGLWRRARWSRLTLFGGAWLALAQMAWMLIVTLEWFHGSRAGMLYQVNVLNVAWVLLILAVAPTERLAR